MEPPTCPDDLAWRIARDAQGYLDAGARYWPTANHLVLVGLDADGNLKGDGRVVCRACARVAAREAMTRLAEIAATTTCRDDLPYLDLIGDPSPANCPCSICGDCP